MPRILALIPLLTISYYYSQGGGFRRFWLVCAKLGKMIIVFARKRESRVSAIFFWGVFFGCFFCVFCAFWGVFLRYFFFFFFRALARAKFWVYFSR